MNEPETDNSSLQPSRAPTEIEPHSIPIPLPPSPGSRIQVGVESFQYFGPHLPASLLEAIEAVVPGGAKQLLEDSLKETALQRQLIEQESQHRQGLENRKHSLEDRQHSDEVQGRWRGQMCFTLLGLGAIGAGVYLANPWALGTIVATVFGGGLLSRYVSGATRSQTSDAKDLPEKPPQSQLPAPKPKPPSQPRGKRSKK